MDSYARHTVSGWMAVVAPVTLVLFTGCAPAPQPEPEPPFLHRFTQHIHPDAPEREIKAMYGVQYRNVLDAAFSTGYSRIAIRRNGWVPLAPYVDADQLHPDALGVNVVVEGKSGGVGVSILFKQDNVAEALQSERIKLFEPGAPPPDFADLSGNMFVAEILPFPRAIAVPPVAVPANARLETAFGFGYAVSNRTQFSGFRSEPHADPGKGWNAPIRFSITAATDGETREIFSTVERQPAPDAWDQRQWQEVRVDLAAYAGQEVVFTFRAEDARELSEDQRRASPVLASPVWANPAVKNEPALDGDRPPNVILVCLDTLRADRLGAYGYERGTSPHLDKLASEGIVFEHCYSPTSWTLPAHSSLFTGLAPALHSSGMLAGYGLLDEYTTLAELLRARGYLTAAFTEGYAVSGGLGLFQGFEIYAHATPTRSEMPPPGTVQKTFNAGEQWITRNAPFPYFAFLHTYEIHHPYTAPPEFMQRFVDADYLAGRAVPEAGSPEFFRLARQTYDAGIAYTDAVLGALLERLEASGELDRSYVIVVSDHGERLGEHYDPTSPFSRVPHGVTLYDPVLHVPCIIRPPGGLDAPRRVSEPVSLTDVFATILEVTGVEYDSGALDSYSLVPLFEEAPDNRFARQRTTAELVHFGDNRHTKLAVHDGPWKYIVQARSTTPEIVPAPGNPISIHPDHMQRNAAPELLLLDLARRAMDENIDAPLAFEYLLFNLDDDPGELNNVAAAQPEKAREMHALLTDELRRMHENADASTGDGAYLELSPEGEEALRALGYIE